MKIKTKLISSMAVLAAVVSAACISVSASYYTCTKTVDSKGYNVSLGSENECFLVDTSAKGSLKLSYVKTKAGNQSGKTYENVYARTYISTLDAKINVYASFVNASTNKLGLSDNQSKIVDSTGMTVADKSVSGTAKSGSVLVECTTIRQHYGDGSNYTEYPVNTYVIYSYS